VLCNFIFDLMSIIYAHRHYIAEVSMVSGVWYYTEFLFGCWLFVCVKE